MVWMLRDSMVSDSPGTGEYVRKSPLLQKNEIARAGYEGRPPAGSSRKNVRDGEERARAKREVKASLLRSVPQNHPG